MNFIKKLGIQGKTLLVVSLFCIIIAVLGSVSWYGLNSIDNALMFFSTDTLPRQKYLDDIMENIAKIQRSERTLLIQEYSSDVDERKNQQKLLDESWNKIGEVYQKYEKLTQSEKGKELWATFSEELGKWKKEHQKVIEFINNNNRDEALEQSEDQARTAAIMTKKAVSAVVEFNEELIHSTQQRAENAADKTKLIIAIAAVLADILCLVIGILASIYIIKSIRKPVDALSEGFDKISAAVAEVSASSNQVADGASNQAASLEEVSSSLEETSAMTKNNAENASQADALMHDIRKNISETGSDMKSLKKSMEEITDASTQTQKIIKTIDEIAFQTNLLALNAAVEAARAGEAGAGFAVVADEVRNLAKRSAEAAKNTAELIEGTVEKVKVGSGIVVNTTENFEKIHTDSEKIASLVSEISGASAEQDKGISEITKAVSEIDQVTQGNAANAEESAAAAQDVETQVRDMLELRDDLIDFINGK
ncbi:methyl-accepting chemotaxis protein [Candidatus Gracilibacteria bacterium]|nr:methyl-accepting chemotaxis protein [Candidatus Gracilibacteria bacterium]